MTGREYRIARTLCVLKVYPERLANIGNNPIQI